MIKILSIRTQDRTSLVPYNKQVTVTRGGAINMVFDDNSILLLGKYANEERALEVLDEITKVSVGRILIPQTSNKKDYNEYTIYTTKTNQEEIIALPTVYQMPKE